MTTRKRTAPPTQEDNGAPAFGAVWKIIVGVIGTVLATGSVSMIGWALNINEQLTALRLDVEHLKTQDVALDARTKRVDTLEIEVGKLSANIIHVQGVQSTSNAALGERIRDIEREQRWRDRMGKSK